MPEDVPTGFDNHVIMLNYSEVHFLDMEVRWFGQAVRELHRGDPQVQITSVMRAWSRVCEKFRTAGRRLLFSGPKGRKRLNGVLREMVKLWEHAERSTGGDSFYVQVQVRGGLVQARAFKSQYYLGQPIRSPHTPGG